jgi:hypothetical protein
VGFADPILSAGLTLTHTGARELAYTILELDRSEHDPAWLKQHFEATQQKRVKQHIRFADFWYAANGQFTEIQELCQQIARDAGMDFTPRSAWRWFAQGGFTNDVTGQTGCGGFDLGAVKQIAQRLTKSPSKWLLNDYNVFKLNLLGAEEHAIPVYEQGRIHSAKAWTRGGRRLTATGMFGTLVELLKSASDAATIFRTLQAAAAEQLVEQHRHIGMQHALQSLEVMVTDGWVTAKLDPSKPKIVMTTPDEGRFIHKNTEDASTARRPRTA